MPLFDGLKIKEQPCFRLHQGKYPVIDLSFKGLKTLNFKDTFESIKRLIQLECQKHAYLKESTQLNKQQKLGFEQLFSGSAPTHLWQNSLKDLSGNISELKR